MTTYRYDPESDKVVEGSALERRNKLTRFQRGHSEGGISFQFPPDWDDGSGTIRHVKDGPYKGRVMFSGKQEASEIAKRHEGMDGTPTTYDPN